MYRWSKRDADDQGELVGRSASAAATDTMHGGGDGNDDGEEGKGDPSMPAPTPVWRESRTERVR